MLQPKAIGPDDSRFSISRDRCAGALLVFGAWTLVGAFDISKRVVESFTQYGRALEGADILLTFESVWLWAAFTPLIFYLAGRYPIERENWGRRIVLHFAFAIAVAGLDVAVDHVFVAAMAPGRARPIARRFLGESFINVYSYFATFAAGAALRFYRLYHGRRLVAAQLETELAQAKLSALELRLRPHFLYNALHTIGGLVRTGDRDAAVRTIAGLGDLLREVLRVEDTQEVPLSRELDLVSRYLGIEQARFGDRLRVHLTVASETRAARVPNLLLQPLVENAVRHGVESNVSGGDVFLDAYRRGDELCVDVRDTGSGPREGEGGHGIGLSTTRARLQHLYGDAHLLELGRAEGGGGVTSLRIPFRTMLTEPSR